MVINPFITLSFGRASQQPTEEKNSECIALLIIQLGYVKSNALYNVISH